MSIALRSVGSRGTTAPGVPAGSLAYDVVLLVVDCNVITTSTAPSCAGFTLAGISGSGAGGTSGRSIAFLIKRLSAPETGSTYTVTAPVSGSIAAAEAYCFSGVEWNGTYFTTPNIVGTATAGTATPTVSITDSAGDQRILAFATSGGAVTVSAMPGSGWTEISPTAASVMHALTQSSPGGASGNLIATMSASSNPRVAGVISLIAATTSPPSPSTQVYYKSSTGTVVQATPKVKKSDGTIVTATICYKDLTGAIIVI